jgi:hypothetical protein
LTAARFARAEKAAQPPIQNLESRMSAIWLAMLRAVFDGVKKASLGIQARAA